MGLQASVKGRVVYQKVAWRYTLSNAAVFSGIESSLSPSLLPPSLPPFLPPSFLPSLSSGTQHSFSEEEKLAFVDWINYQLEEDPDIQTLLPIPEDGNALFEAVHDGLILW